jgi:hypothetical protein
VACVVVDEQFVDLDDVGVGELLEVGEFFLQIFNDLIVPGFYDLDCVALFTDAVLALLDESYGPLFSLPVRESAVRRRSLQNWS